MNFLSHYNNQGIDPQKPILLFEEGDHKIYCLGIDTLGIK